MTSYKISIIVPIYKAEQYIEECVESLLNQDFDSIEYIFVNDCTPDKSIDILKATIKKYPHRKQDIKIIHNIENKGSGYTRKKGMQSATGEYVIQIDADDWVETNMCSELYDVAKQIDADIVVCDYFENFLDKQIYLTQKCSQDNWVGFRSILLGTLHGSLCNKLVKRELYVTHNIYTPESFSLYEDKITTLPLFLKAKKIGYVEKAFLHYRKHSNSMTAVIVNDKMVKDTNLFIERLYNFFVEEHLLPKYQYELNACILYHKKIFMLDEKYYVYWDTIHPEVNRLKYIQGIELYDWKKKLVTALAMIFSKKIMQYIFTYHKLN